MINRNPFTRLDPYARWLMWLTLGWTVVWFMDVVSGAGWLPRVGCLFDLAVMFAGFLLLNASIGFFLVRLVHRQFAMSAFLAASIIVLAVVGSRKIPNKPTQICHIPGAPITIRFYYHDSVGGAIGSDRVSVTYADDVMPETGIFFAYSSPVITSVICREDGVILNQLHDEPIFLPLSWIQEDLIEQPLQFYKGRLESMRYADDVRGWSSVFIPTPTLATP